MIFISENTDVKYTCVSLGNSISVHMINKVLVYITFSYTAVAIVALHPCTCSTHEEHFSCGLFYTTATMKYLHFVAFNEAGYSVIMVLFS